MKHVKRIVLIISVTAALVEASCDLSDMARALPYLSSAETNCTTNADCTSVKCSGQHEGKAFIAGMVLSLCDAEPSISIIAHVPHLGVKDWNAVFRNNTRLRVPGFRPPSSFSQTGMNSVFVEVSIARRSDSEFALDLMLKGCLDENNCPLINATLQNREISTHCVNKTPKQGTKECDISVPFICSENETCQQIESGNRGVCVPMSETETVSSTPIPPSTEASTDKQDPAHLAVNVAVPLLFVVLVVSLVIAAYRNGWVRKLRQSMSDRNRFEQLTNNARINDDDDEPLPL